MSVILIPLALHFNSYLALIAVKAECPHPIGQPGLSYEAVQVMLLLQASALSSHLFVHFLLAMPASTFYCEYTSISAYARRALPQDICLVPLFFWFCAQTPPSQRELPQSPIEIIPCTHPSLSRPLSPFSFFSQRSYHPSHIIYLFLY